jgi:hypothetical protein
MPDGMRTRLPSTHTAAPPTSYPHTVSAVTVPVTAAGTTTSSAGWRDHVLEPLFPVTE